MRLFIEPSDVLLFRDGKPFSAGDDHAARSIFPPSPRTFQGAVRAAILSRHGFDMAKASSIIGDSNSYGRLQQMRGPFIARQSGNEDPQRLLPLPLSVGLTKDRNNPQPVITSPADTPMVTDLNLQLPWAKCADRLETPRAFVTWDGLCGYLADGALGRPAIVEENEILKYEVRTGIKRSHTRHAADEGQLYSVSFIRLEKGIGFIYEIDGVDGELDDEGLLVLGGESRPAYYRKLGQGPACPANVLDKIKQDIDKNHVFKLYLAAPAIFTGGWLPDGVTKAGGYSGKLNGITVKLVSAAVGKYIPAGGWEMRPASGPQKPRAIRRAVPAGSIYWFQTEAAADEVIGKLDNKCISDIDREIGFGLSFVGGSN